MTAAHGELALVSAKVLDGTAPVGLVRWGTGAEDGWSILAAEDALEPASARVRMCCLHCLLGVVDAEVGAGMDAARGDAAEYRSDVGIAVLEGGVWVTGNAAFDVLDGQVGN